MKIGYDLELVRRGASHVAVAIITAAVLDGAFGNRNIGAAALIAAGGILLLLASGITPRKPL